MKADQYSIDEIARLWHSPASALPSRLSMANLATNAIRLGSVPREVSWRFVEIAQGTLPQAFYIPR